jgi:hypothetical protein
MRRAANRDKGERLIVSALRSSGASVAFWGEDGAPDLVVGHQGRVFLLEVKAPLGPRGGSRSADGQHLNQKQERWHAAWKGHVAVVRSVTDALAAVGIGCS